MAHLVKYETRQYLTKYEVSAQKERKGNSFSHESHHHSWELKKTVQPHSVPSKVFFHWVREEITWRLTQPCVPPPSTGRHTSCSLPAHWCKLSEFHKVPISSSFYSSDALFYEPHRWSACHFRRSKSLLFTASMWHVFSPDGCSVWHNVEAQASNSSSVSYLLHGLGQVTSILCASGSPYVKGC